MVLIGRFPQNINLSYSYRFDFWLQVEELEREMLEGSDSTIGQGHSDVGNGAKFSQERPTGSGDGKQEVTQNTHATKVQSENCVELITKCWNVFIGIWNIWEEFTMIFMQRNL